MTDIVRIVLQTRLTKLISNFQSCSVCVCPYSLHLGLRSFRKYSQQLGTAASQHLRAEPSTRRRRVTNTAKPHRTHHHGCESGGQEVKEGGQAKGGRRGQRPARGGIQGGTRRGTRPRAGGRRGRTPERPRRGEEAQIHRGCRARSPRRRRRRGRIRRRRQEVREEARREEGQKGGRRHERCFRRLRRATRNPGRPGRGRRQGRGRQAHRGGGRRIPRGARHRGGRGHPRSNHQIPRCALPTEAHRSFTQARIRVPDAHPGAGVAPRRQGQGRHRHRQDGLRENLRLPPPGARQDHETRRHRRARHGDGRRAFPPSRSRPARHRPRAHARARHPDRRRVRQVLRRRGSQDGHALRRRVQG